MMDCNALNLLIEKQLKNTKLKRVVIGKGACLAVDGLIAERKPLVIFDRYGEAFLDSISDDKRDYLKIDESDLDGSFFEFVCGRAKDYGVLISFGGKGANYLCKAVATKLKIDHISIAASPACALFAAGVLEKSDTGLSKYHECDAPSCVVYDTAVWGTSTKSQAIGAIGNILGEFLGLTDYRLHCLMTDQTPDESAVKPAFDAAKECAESALSSAITEKRLISLAIASAAFSIAFSMSKDMALLQGDYLGMSEFIKQNLKRNGRDDVPRRLINGMCAASLYSIYPYAYGALKTQTLHKKRRFNMNEWSYALHRKLPLKSAEIIALETQTAFRQENNALIRKNRILANKEAFIDVLNQVPLLHDVFKAYAAAGGASYYSQLDIGRMLMKDAFLYGKDLSLSYGILGLLSDLDSLDYAIDDLLYSW